MRDHVSHFMARDDEEGRDGQHYESDRRWKVFLAVGPAFGHISTKRYEPPAWLHAAKYQEGK